jgi:predicted amidohydrolase YtcJ
VFHGNSLSGRTCWLSEPYEIINPKTGEKDYFGIPPDRTQEDLDALIAKIHKAGFQAAVHSNGDREIPMVLDAIERAMNTNPRPNPRHRIEHCSVSTPEIIERIKELGLVIAPHSYIYEHGDKMETYGAWRWDHMHANKTMIDTGIMVAQNSDSPVSPAIPLLRIQSMVTRQSKEGKVYGASQKVSAEEAIYTWTMGGAFATFEENIKGSLTPGKLADFVILSEDPREVPH